MYWSIITSQSVFPEWMNEWINTWMHKSQLLPFLPLTLKPSHTYKFASSGLYHLSSGLYHLSSNLGTFAPTILCVWMLLWPSLADWLHISTPSSSVSLIRRLSLTVHQLDLYVPHPTAPTFYWTLPPEHHTANFCPSHFHSFVFVYLCFLFSLLSFNLLESGLVPFRPACLEANPVPGI